MKYMVVETHLSYAVVLDEDGRFIKVANLHYEVGQTLTHIEEMIIPPSTSSAPKKKGFKYTIIALAACLLIAVSYQIQVVQSPYASIHMAINPSIRIDVNKNNKVLSITGTNSDGNLLIENYDYKKKDFNLVIDELVNKAISMDYLNESGKVSLHLDSKDSTWVSKHNDSIPTYLQESLKFTIPIKLEIDDNIYKNQSTDYYDVTDYNISPGDTNYDDDSDINDDNNDSDVDTNYSDNSNLDTNYNPDTNYGNNSNSDTNYGNNSDSNTNYSDNDYNNDDIDYNDTNYNSDTSITQDDDSDDNDYSESDYLDSQNQTPYTAEPDNSSTNYVQTNYSNNNNTVYGDNQI